jgi:hypothetical protein
MKLTNTKRALMGAAAIVILLGFLLYRRGGAALTERDYLIGGAALVLISMNVIGSYYFDSKAHEEELRRK